ncbi:MAG: PAS domain S-box protein [Elusimicrobia bacterium]|nr:PAS domain S-box protein [Elusimicrobiota bacterium]
MPKPSDAEADQNFAVLAHLCEHMPAGVGLIDRDFRYVLLNDALARFHGLAQTPAPGRTVAELDARLWTSLEPALKQAVGGQPALDRELCGAPGPDGLETYWRYSCFAVNLLGGITGVGLIAHDITERRRTQTALAARDALYLMLSRAGAAANQSRGAAELYPEICRIAVETGGFLSAYIGVVEGDHLRIESCHGKALDYIKELTIPLGEDAHPGPAWTALKRERPVIVNDFLSDPMTVPWHEDARRAGIAASATFPLREGGRPVAVLGLYAGRTNFFTPDQLATLTEIAPIVSLALDRFAAEKRRRADEEELRLRDRAIQAASQGIIIADALAPDMPIIFVSPGFVRLTGYSLGEVLGRNGRFLQGRDTDPAAVAKIRAALASGRECRVELLNYRKNGSTFWNELTISPILDAGGAVTHFVGVQTDVTERRRLEEQFRQSQKMEAVGQLAGGIAHDFNNLLTIIGVAGETLLAQTAPDDARCALIAEMLDAGGRAAVLTRQLLAFSRRQILEPKIVSLNDVVADAERLLRRLIGEHVVLKTTAAPDLWLVKADLSQLTQILINLAVNARDAMPKGGQLRVETRNVSLAQDDCLRLGDVVPGRYVELAVSDDGQGIQPTVQPRIFEPFFSTKPPGKGSGLGLSTVHGIVAQSHGAVAVESAPGRGATFRIYLPRADEGQKAPRTDAGAAEAFAHGAETLLLVEDESGVRLVAGRVLRTCGYTVLEAADGEEALSVAAAHAGQIDLLVSDVVMPKLGGRELAERLRAVRPKCKILFMSGYTDDAALRDGVSSAEFAFLPKPFRPYELAEKVREVLIPRT